MKDLNKENKKASDMKRKLQEKRTRSQKNNRSSMPLTFDIEEGIRWEGEEDNREVEQE